MSQAEPTRQHQVGITNAQEANPNAEISRLTREMNARFAAKEYAEAARIALSITALSKDELATAFQQHGVTIMHLNAEAFGIFEGEIEPAYDLQVDGTTPNVIAAATAFGKRHAQKMVLIARKLQEEEEGSSARLGLSITLQTPISVNEAVLIAALAKECGLLGATFSPQRQGAIVLYHTDNLGLSPEAFSTAAEQFIDHLTARYAQLRYDIQKYTIHLTSP